MSYTSHSVLLPFYFRQTIFRPWSRFGSRRVQLNFLQSPAGVDGATFAPSGPKRRGVRTASCAHTTRARSGLCLR